MKDCCSGQPEAEPAARGDASHTLSSVATSKLLEQRERFLEFLAPRVGSAQVAEDVLQDAYAKAFEHGWQLRDDETVVPWFFRILRNAVSERARRATAATRALEQLASELDAMGGRETRQGVTCPCVARVMRTLKQEYQAPLRAIDLAGRDLRAFAAEAGITPNNAAVRLHRARAALANGLRSTCRTCAPHGCFDCTCETKD